MVPRLTKRLMQYSFDPASLNDLEVYDVPQDLLPILEAERRHLEDSVIVRDFDLHSRDVGSLFEDFDPDALNKHHAQSHLEDSSIIDLPQRRSHAEAMADLIGAKKSSNQIVYKPNSCMEWHTNSNAKGVRVYFIYSYGDSVFRYYDNNLKKTVDSHDLKGKWCMRMFNIPRGELLWHTIATNDYRIAYGFAF